MSLDKDTYFDIIKKTTLTSIDLVIICDNQILLGLRNNNPARNFWFVPGCRTRKNEKINEGIIRVAKTELNLDVIEKLILITS